MKKEISKKIEKKEGNEEKEGNKEAESEDEEEPIPEPVYLTAKEARKHRFNGIDHPQMVYF